jgi:hypothetical protein
VSGSSAGGSAGAGAGAGSSGSDVRSRFQAAARKAVNLQRSLDGELEDSDTVKDMSNKWVVSLTVPCRCHCHNGKAVPWEVVYPG